MEQFLAFVGNHWGMWSAFIVLLAVLITFEMQSQFSRVKRLIPNDAVQLMNREDALVIDLRDSNAYQQGHILGAKQVTQEQALVTLEKMQVEKNHPILLSCQAGQLSQKVGQELVKAGFNQVAILGGGVNAWTQANLPLVKG